MAQQNRGRTGLLLRYNQPTVVSQRVYDFRACPKVDQDEVLSGVDGAVVRLSGVVILGGIKAVLAGNGDHPGNDVRCALSRWRIASLSAQVAAVQRRWYYGHHAQMLDP